MSQPAVVIDGVWKKFRRGELYDSLRDLIPALAARLLRPRPAEALGEREFWALQDVSFEIGRGEAFGVVGSNGAGKSTLLKLLSGIMQPTRGTVGVHGRLSALIEVSAGFHPDLTGRENVFLNGAILGMSRAEIRRRFDEIVAFAGLEEFIDTPVKRYSSGMYARLGFSVAAHVSPDILIVDEVLSVGDYLFQQKCLDRMQDVIRGGATVLFVSHNLRAISMLCSRAVLLEKGRTLAVGPSSEIVQHYMTRSRAARAAAPAGAAQVTRVTVEAPGHAGALFRSGQEVEVTVEARATEAVRDLSVVIMVTDEGQYPVFDTCTQRLGAGPVAIEAGETVRYRFRLRLELGQGTYHVNAYLHRYVTNQAVDRWLAAATFFVEGTPAFRGVSNLQPVLVAVGPAAPPPAVAAAPA